MFFVVQLVKTKVDSIVGKVKRRLLITYDTYQAPMNFIFAKSSQEIFSKIETAHLQLKNSVTSTMNKYFPAGNLLIFFVGILYFVYISIPLTILTYMWNIGMLVCVRRSFHARRFFMHADAMLTIGNFVLWIPTFP
jgi:hypothetical protein